MGKAWRGQFTIRFISWASRHRSLELCPAGIFLYPNAAMYSGRKTTLGPNMTARPCHGLGRARALRWCLGERPMSPDPWQRLSETMDTDDVHMVPGWKVSAAKVFA